MIGNQVGHVMHYYAKAGAGVVMLIENLHVGDRVRVEAHGGGFEQTVSSMEFAHKPLNGAAAGQEVTVKFDRPAHEGCKVFRLE